MFKFQRPFLFISSLFIITASLAQSDTTTQPSVSYKISLDYLSNYVYTGRADSLKNPYQSVTFGFTTKTGWYGNITSNYLLNQLDTRLDYFQFDLGYSYTLGKKWEGDIYFSKYAYTGGSSLISGNATMDIGASLNADLGFVQFNNTFDIFFVSKADIQYSPSIEKHFSLGSKTNLSVTPALSANFNTLNFYESTFSRRQGGKKPGALLGNIQSSTAVNNNNFKLLDIELSLPLNYENEHWGFYFTPTFALPINPVYTTTINKITGVGGAVISNQINSTPYSELNLKNIFFFQLGLSYKF